MEQTTWQAAPAMWFVERSGVGLNALLGTCRGASVQAIERDSGHVSALYELYDAEIGNSKESRCYHEARRASNEHHWLGDLRS